MSLKKGITCSNIGIISYGSPSSKSLHLMGNSGFLRTSIGQKVIFDCVIRGKPGATELIRLSVLVGHRSQATPERQPYNINRVFTRVWCMTCIGRKCEYRLQDVNVRSCGIQDIQLNSLNDRFWPISVVQLPTKCHGLPPGERP